MTDKTKELIQIYLSMLKLTMKENGIIFAFAVNERDVNDAKLLFIDKKQYFEKDMADGFAMSLTELNRGLL